MAKPNAIAFDLTGQRFGRLVALEEAGRAKSHNVLWRCQCDCGRPTTAFRSNLKSGRTKSCGCLQGGNHHGHYRRGKRSPTYLSWLGMLARCNNPNRKDYKRYGGRGITVCKRWLKFINFLADMGERPEGRSIDRINNDGNYDPGNCRWSNPKEQANNRHPRGS